MLRDACVLTFTSKDNILALFISIYAAILGVNNLCAGRYGEDEINSSNILTNQYQWYQSKSVKERVVRDSIGMLETLVANDLLKEQASLDYLEDLKEEAARYKKEKKEILHGSNSIDPSEWVQPINGEFGKVEGAIELEAKVKSLSAAGNRFDMASLLLEICLVIGAIGVLLKEEQTKCKILYVMWGLGSAGFGMFVWAMVGLY